MGEAIGADRILPVGTMTMHFRTFLALGALLALLVAPVPLSACGGCEGCQPSPCGAGSCHGATLAAPDCCGPTTTRAAVVDHGPQAPPVRAWIEASDPGGLSRSPGSTPVNDPRAAAAPPRETALYTLLSTLLI